MAPDCPALAAGIATGPQLGLGGRGGPPSPPFLEGGAFIVAWMMGVLAGPIVLAGFGVYLCRGPRRHRRLTREQIAELEILADLSADLVHRSPGPAASGSGTCGTGSAWN